ncbi:uncharacterized protein LOC123009983 [Tribolium madens]|uniref:uncharacterized protein LOC123009983 n=1 Tax=Tribolium madens TaxID=41895 RepID=UPI001CF74B80|nr:uncharacterized protein LOC123009983 [Tribolium madens]
MLVIYLIFLGAGPIWGAKDSYLEAYEASHKGPQKTDREYNEMFPYPGPPKYTYGPPSAPAYGPPLQPYPVPVYGPPAPAPIYGTPHGVLGLLDKLKFKLDLFTLGKILLKIVLFKKFVSFVAILCLLLFIPYLKHKVDGGMPEGGDDDDEAMRSFKNQASDKFLDNISQFVVGAIDNFSQKYQGEKCDNFYCRTRKIVQEIDNKITYKKLAGLYFKDAQ